MRAVVICGCIEAIGNDLQKNIPGAGSRHRAGRNRTAEQKEQGQKFAYPIEWFCHGFVKEEKTGTEVPACLLLWTQQAYERYTLLPSRSEFLKT